MHWPHTSPHLQHTMPSQRRHTVSPLLSMQASANYCRPQHMHIITPLYLCSPCARMTVVQAHETNLQLPNTTATSIGTQQHQQSQQQQQRSIAPIINNAAPSTLQSTASATSTRLPMPSQSSSNSSSSSSNMSMQSSSIATPASSSTSRTDSSTSALSTSKPVAASTYGSKKKQKQDMGLRHMFAGSVAGMVSKTMLQPLGQFDELHKVSTRCIVSHCMQNLRIHFAHAQCNVTLTHA